MSRLNAVLLLCAERDCRIANPHLHCAVCGHPFWSIDDKGHGPGAFEDSRGATPVLCADCTDAALCAGCVSLDHGRCRRCSDEAARESAIALDDVADESVSEPALIADGSPDDQAAVSIYRPADLVASMDDDSLVVAYVERRAAVERETTRLQERLQADRALIAAAQAEIIRRVDDAGGKTLAHDEYDVLVERTKTTARDIAVLRELEGRVPAEQLAPALYLKQREPEWTAHVAKLTALQRRYGEQSEIGRIIARGLRAEYGAPRLSVMPREKQKVVSP